MMRNGEKRTARRIRLDQPIAGSLSHVAISVVDLSTSGARIQHDVSLSIHSGKRFVLDFNCGGENFHLPCTVARSRLEMNRSAHRTIYTTGVRFLDVDDANAERLWGLIALLAVDLIAHEAVAAESPSDFEILH